MPKQSKPNPDTQWWTSTDVADYLNIGISTVSSYRHRRQMPEPDDKIGRTWIWSPSRIIEWDKQRRKNRENQGLTLSPSTDLEWWNIGDVADYLNVRPATTSTYYTRGKLPTPDKIINRSPLWKPIRIIEWANERHRNARGGRMPPGSS